MNTEVITPTEVAALNSAREALRAIAARNFDMTVHGTALLTEHAVFTVLNHAHSYGGAELTIEELHNGPLGKAA